MIKPSPLVAEYRLLHFAEQPRAYAAYMSPEQNPEAKDQPKQRENVPATQMEEVSKFAQQQAAREINTARSGLSIFGKFFNFLGRLFPFAFLGAAAKGRFNQLPRGIQMAQAPDKAFNAQYRAFRNQAPAISDVPSSVNGVLPAANEQRTPEANPSQEPSPTPSKPVKQESVTKPGPVKKLTIPEKKPIEDSPEKTGKITWSRGGFVYHATIGLPIIRVTVPRKPQGAEWEEKHRREEEIAFGPRNPDDPPDAPWRQALRRLVEFHGGKEGDTYTSGAILEGCLDFFQQLSAQLQTTYIPYDRIVGGEKGYEYRKSEDGKMIERRKIGSDAVEVMTEQKLLWGNTQEGTDIIKCDPIFPERIGYYGNVGIPVIRARFSSAMLTEWERAEYLKISLSSELIRKSSEPGTEEFKLHKKSEQRYWERLEVTDDRICLTVGHPRFFKVLHQQLRENFVSYKNVVGGQAGFEYRRSQDGNRIERRNIQTGDIQRMGSDGVWAA